MRLSASSRDMLALGFCVLLSALASVQGLGFSSDDWDTMAAFANARSHSLPALFTAGYHPAINHTRPGEILYQATLYWLFGLSPLGYHVINAIVLAAMAMLLAALLHELGAPRVLALVVPLVYAFLPHYSSARFWVAAFIAIASQALCFLSLYCDLRAARNGCAHPWRWKVAGLVALIASALTYEVTLPLFLLGPLLTWYRLRRGSRSGEALPVHRRHYWGLIGANVIALIAIGLFKYRVSVRIDDRAGVLTAGGGRASLRETAIASLRGVIQGVSVNFGDYGIGLPHVVVRILHQRPPWSTIALSILAGVAIFALLSPIVGKTDTALSWTRQFAIAVLAGVLIFALGYAIFATNRNVQFTPTGISNRTATAAALGVAIVFVGLIGRGATLLPSAPLCRLLG